MQPFTHSSNLVRALRIAVARRLAGADGKMAAAGAWTRAQLRQAGFDLVGLEYYACAAHHDLALPDGTVPTT
jgi:hypothetical protein